MKLLSAYNTFTETKKNKQKSSRLMLFIKLLDAVYLFFGLLVLHATPDSLRLVIGAHGTDVVTGEKLHWS